MDNIRDWAALNNLTLNVIKTTETVIYDCRKTQPDTLPPLPGITRVDTLRVLGVTRTRRLSASDHIRRVVSKCSQTLYALRVLRHHGLTDAGLHTVFRSVVVAKLLYACSEWSGFTTASDRIASTRSSAAANARATVSQIYRPSTNCWKTLTINCSINSVITPNTHSTIFYHHLTWHHNITISVPPHPTTDNYLHAPDTWLMPTSSQDYCIRTVTDL